MAGLVRILLIGFLVSVLVGCAGHSHQLLSAKGDGVVIGTFSHEGNTEPSMMVEFAGRQYSSRGFTITRSQNLAELKKQLGGSGSKHYQRVMSGFDNDHWTKPLTR